MLDDTSVGDEGTKGSSYTVISVGLRLKIFPLLSLLPHIDKLSIQDKN